MDEQDERDGQDWVCIWDGGDFGEIRLTSSHFRSFEVGRWDGSWGKMGGGEGGFGGNNDGFDGLGGGFGGAELELARDCQNQDFRD